MAFYREIILAIVSTGRCASRMSRRTPVLALAAGLALLAASAAATGFFPDGLKARDRDRLNAFDEVRAEAIAEARGGGEEGDVAMLDAILEGEAAPIGPRDIAGQWRCRTIKLGGLRPLTVYGDFSCRITDGPEGLRLEKLTGSQRMAGTFYDVGEARLGYAGALSIGNETQGRYGKDAQRDQAGYLIPLDDRRMRLELPLPRYESRFDILELRR